MIEERDVKHARNLVKILTSDCAKFEISGVEAFGLGTALNWLLTIEPRYKKQLEAKEQRASKKKVTKKKVTKKATVKK